MFRREPEACELEERDTFIALAVDVSWRDRENEVGLVAQRLRAKSSLQCQIRFLRL